MIGGWETSSSQRINTKFVYLSSTWDFLIEFHLSNRFDYTYQNLLKLL